MQWLHELVSNIARVRTNMAGTQTSMIEKNKTDAALLRIPTREIKTKIAREN
jgi:hypothetical protein